MFFLPPAKDLSYLIQILVGWAEHHIIPLSSFHDPAYIIRYFLILPPAAPAVPAAHITGCQYQAVFLGKGGLCIYGILFLAAAEQFLIVLDGQQGRGKEYGALPPVQTFLQVQGRIDAQELYHKLSVRKKPGIDPIIVIQPVIDI